MKELSIVFHRNGVIYDYKKEFNDNGEFLKIVLCMWVNKNEKNQSELLPIALKWMK